MTMVSGSRRERQAGKGIIAFLIALVVVVFGGITIKENLRVKKRQVAMNDYVEDLLRRAGRERMPVANVHFDLVKQAKKMELPISGKAIEVTQKGDRWRVHMEWDDHVKLPGYSYVKHQVIDKTWNNISR